MIYVASSWRNTLQPEIVSLLRSWRHDVYDFRHPAEDNDGFSWSEIHPDWQNWTPQQYREALQHPVAKRGYNFDIKALRMCDTCLLVLPSGRSASWEFGYAMGMGKKGYVVMFEPFEPELMYREATIITTRKEFRALFENPEQ